jgi:uncharacterized protein (TIGR03435 family)
MYFRSLLIGVLAVSSAAAQAIAPPAFEAASIKLSQPGVRSPSVISNPGRWSCANCTLFAIFTNAFAVFEYQIVAPEWTRTVMFDVDGKLPDGAKREDLRPMLQELLQERLKMKMHRESREMSVYELVIANGGPKMKQVTEPATPPPPGPDVDRNGFPNVPNGSGMRALNGRGRIQFRGQTMKNVAHYISAEVDRPVLDATGLEGAYALTLSFRLLQRSAKSISTADQSNSDLGPTIYEAVEEQLGLKLKPAKRSVEVVVIDDVDRTPIEN